MCPPPSLRPHSFLLPVSFQTFISHHFDPRDAPDAISSHSQNSVSFSSGITENPSPFLEPICSLFTPPWFLFSSSLFYFNSLFFTVWYSSTSRPFFCDRKPPYWSHFIQNRVCGISALLPSDLIPSDCNISDEGEKPSRVSYQPKKISLSCIPLLDTRSCLVFRDFKTERRWQIVCVYTGFRGIRYGTDSNFDDSEDWLIREYVWRKELVLSAFHMLTDALCPKSTMVYLYNVRSIWHLTILSAPRGVSML